MEVILTASPEFFERDKDGRAVDMSNSQWAKDQLTFLEKTFGKENVLSCTLHQDEKSPHFHAVIAPITEDGRLSAKLLFNPITMTGYQTQYAEAMAVHGLVRGVEHSQAKHQPMKRMYGQQGQTSTEVGVQLGAASSYQDVQVKRPGVMDAMNLTGWEAKTTAQVNEQARAQVEAANQRAEKAANLAQENAAAKDQVRVLQKQLSTSEGLKEKFRDSVQVAAKLVAGGEEAPKFANWGNQLLDKAVQGVRLGRERVATLNTEADQADKEGKYPLVADLREGKIKDQETKNKLLEANLSRFVGGRSRLADLDARQAKQEQAAKLAAEQKQAKQAKQEADRVKVAAEREAQQAKDKKEQADKAARDLIAQQKAETARIIKYELSLMDRAFTIYRWQIKPDELTACLIVPTEKAEAVRKALTIAGNSYASPLGVQGEPHRKDGLVAVYVQYQPSFAHQASQYFDRVRAGGGQVHEHAGSQTRREQLQAQPQQKTQTREQGPAPSKDIEIGG